MPFDLSRWRRWTALACVMAAIGLALAGSWAFLVSLRPCRVSLDPGTVVDFHLNTTYTELQAHGMKGRPRERSSRITLVCIGQGNEVALVDPDNGRDDGVSLLSFQSDGTARLFNDDGLTDVGKALGFFDFNLLPLPPGHEQNWKVSLVYAALPEGRRQVLGQVRRTANSARPEFELRLPTVEWVNDQNRYMQVRNLVCSYRFDPSRGIVDRARIACETGFERADGVHRYEIAVDLDLVGIQRGVGDTASLRDLALATAQTQRALAQSQLSRLAPLLQRLQSGGIEAPALREVADRLRVQVSGRLAPQREDEVIAPGPRRQTPEPRREHVQTPGPSVNNGVNNNGGDVLPSDAKFVLQVASIAKTRRAAADTLVKRLRDAGVPAYIDERGSWLAVRAGPFVERDESFAAAAKKIVGSPPQWRTLP
jgi:hypothetical protein